MSRSRNRDYSNRPWYCHLSPICKVRARLPLDEGPKSPLLQLPNNILVKVAHLLDPKSLVVLAMSCRALFFFVRGSKAIQVTYTMTLVRRNSGLYRVCDRTKKERPVSKLMEHLHKWPAITVTVPLLNIIEMAIGYHRVLGVIDVTLEKYALTKVHSIVGLLPHENHREAMRMAQFVKKYNVAQVHIVGYHDPPSTAITEELFSVNVRQLTAVSTISLTQSNLDVSSIAGCGIANLRMDASKRGFQAAIKVWLETTTMEKWSFGLGDLDFMKAFAQYNLQCYDEDAPALIDAGSSSVLWKMHGDARIQNAQFHMKRHDGRVIRIAVVERPIELRMDRRFPYRTTDLYNVEFRFCPGHEIPIPFR